MPSIDRLPARVLLVEDDALLAGLVQRHLTDSGFDVSWVADSTAATDHLQHQPVDLVVLDIMLPGEDGLSFCRRLRRERDVGIILVTARGEEADRVLGLELGADDYLPKPFSLWELEARLKALLRRCRRLEPPAVRRVGPVSVDTGLRQVTVNDRPVALTRSEFDLLERLTRQPGRVCSRDELLGCIQGGRSEALDRAVDTHISNLRHKIETDPAAPALLQTVWGVGYRFDPP